MANQRQTELYNQQKQKERKNEEILLPCDANIIETFAILFCLYFVCTDNYALNAFYWELFKYALNVDPIEQTLVLLSVYIYRKLQIHRHHSHTNAIYF